MSDAPPVLALVRDLIFSSRIAGVGKAVGVAVRIVREAQALEGREGRLLIVDLNQVGAIEAARRWREAANAPVIGFVSHVDAQTAAAARAAGIDQVMARSRFVERLAELLRGEGNE